MIMVPPGGGGDEPEVDDMQDIMSQYLPQNNTGKWSLIHDVQWWIQDLTDREEGTNLLLFGQFFTNNAWKWRFGWGRASQRPTLDPPMLYANFKM